MSYDCWNPADRRSTCSLTCSVPSRGFCLPSSEASTFFRAARKRKQDGNAREKCSAAGH